MTSIDQGKYDLSTDTNGIKVGVNASKRAAEPGQQAGGCSC